MYIISICEILWNHLLKTLNVPVDENTCYLIYIYIHVLHAALTCDVVYIWNYSRFIGPWDFDKPCRRLRIALCRRSWSSNPPKWFFRQTYAKHALIWCEQICVFHWIGLRENLQETIVFTIKIKGVSCKFSHKPIQMSVLQIFSTCFGIVFPGLHEAAGFDVAWLALCFRGLIGFPKVQSQKNGKTT